MFSVLPINKIREEDTSLVGKNIVTLANLERLGLPVAEGIIVLPPEIHLKTVLQSFHLKDREVFEQRLEIIKKEVKKIAFPEELRKVLFRKNIDTYAMWQSLLEIWISEIRSRIWREGFGQNLTNNLSAQPIFFTSKIIASGQAIFDPHYKTVVITNFTGELNSEEKEKVEKWVKTAQQKLFLPFIYQWVVSSDKGRKVYFTKITPFTESEVKSYQTKKEEGFQVTKVTSPAIATTKILQEVTDHFRIEENAFGVVIKPKGKIDPDKQMLQLVEAANSLPNGVVIYQLSDQLEKINDVRGTLRLIHHKELLKTQSEIFLFARHKKNLLNVSLAIPFVRSSDELMEIKRELSGLGISRKASLKFWVEFAVLENFINIEKYIEVGFDGAIINLDELSLWIAGFHPSETDVNLYKQTDNISKENIQTVLEFIEVGVKKLQKAKIPVLFTGRLSLDDTALHFVTEKGVWGITADAFEVSSLNEHLAFLEKRLVHKRGV